MPRQCYPSNLTDARWARLKPLLLPDRPGGRPRAHPPGRRSIAPSGPGAWRAPGSGSTMSCANWCGCVPGAPRTPSPRSWTVNRPIPPKKGGRGYNGAKKRNGRKRHLLVDTDGLVLLAVVHAADVSDRDGARQGLEGIDERYPLVRKLWVDAGYVGKIVEWAAQTLGLSVTVVRRPRRCQQGRSRRPAAAIGRPYRRWRQSSATSRQSRTAAPCTPGGATCSDRRRYAPRFARSGLDVDVAQRHRVRRARLQLEHERRPIVGVRVVFEVDVVQGDQADLAVRLLQVEALVVTTAAESIDIKLLDAPERLDDVAVEATDLPADVLDSDVGDFNDGIGAAIAMASK